MLKATDGNYYGLASRGNGMLYRVTTAGDVPIVHVFNGSDGQEPAGPLIEASDGNLYGVTLKGGAQNYGTVYRMSLSGQFTSIHSFESPGITLPNSGLIQATDGNLYGTAAHYTYVQGQTTQTSVGGAIYKISTSGDLTVLHEFGYSEGTNPSALIQGSDGYFYGTTAYNVSYGSVFRMDASGNISYLHIFSDTEGHHPKFGVIQGGDGSFYGTTSANTDNGTIFKLTADGQFSTLHVLTGNDGYNPQKLLQGTDGNLYGTTQGYWPGSGPIFTPGSLFKISTSGAYTVLSTGSSIYAAGLIDDGSGALVGATLADTGYPRGTVFRAATSGVKTLLTTFPLTSTEPYSVQSELSQGPDGTIYGTSASGGDFDQGAVFKIALDGSTTLIHSFNGGVGNGPTWPVVVGPDGSLYGSTPTGLVYKISAGGVYQIIHDFGSTGIVSGKLVLDQHGNILGTNELGGVNGAGSIFKITPAGLYTSLHDFSYHTEGTSTLAGIVIGPDGDYYGDCGGGGTNDDGTIFKLTPSGQFTVLYSFADNGDGSAPLGELVVGPDAALYGTTLIYGTIFRITTSGEFSTVHQFLTSEGRGCQNPLVLGPDGVLYGSTSNSFFSYDPDGNVFSLFHTLSTLEGDLANGMIVHSDGRLYGATRLAGSFGSGTFFKITLAPPTPPSVSALAANGQVRLTFGGSSAANTYNVYRSLTSGNEGTTPYRAGLTAPSLIDTSVSNGTRYYYTVSAVNEAGESAPSTEVSATPVAPHATFVGVDSTTQGNWRDKYGVSGFNVIGDTSTGNPHYGTGISLTPGAHNSGIWAASSLSPTCLQPAASGSPNRLAGIWYQTSWTMNVSSTGAHQIELYLLDLPNAGYAETITIKDAVTGAVLNTQTASNFAGGKYYIWNISGNVNVTFTSTAGHWAVLSGIFFGGGTGSKSPSQPTDLVATQTTSGIGLTWTASTGATSYNVYRGTTAGQESTTPIATGIKTTSYTNTGLTPSTTYYYKVVAVNSYAGSFASTESSAIAPSPTATATFVTADTTTHGNFSFISLIHTALARRRLRSTAAISISLGKSRPFAQQ